MTGNQINMLRHLEDVRHNYATESETHRSNVTREYETHRSNLTNEAISRLQLLESNRHNTMSEYISQSNLAEVVRHNTADEKEINRANEAKETEINRHNKKEEEIKYATLESQINLNEAKTIGEYVGGAVDLLGSALGWWQASKSKTSKTNARKPNNTSKKGKS